MPNNQRQHRILRIQKDVLPYALCYHARECERSRSSEKWQEREREREKSGERKRER
jgi:hypothetical protein